ncbi:MAG: ferredoxin-type protein NapF [Psychromonas sp.]|uniref:ferredoxin-type protein NapF n=1 Tax=Psychromonas sp. TaxID=1884585 RepID=UPI0039E69675
MQFDASKRSFFKVKKTIATDHLLPWIKDTQNFLNNCSQCGDCISACPEQIVIKGDGGYPNINFDLGECTFCGKCATSCKEKIFVETSESPWDKKAFINNQCLAFANVYCRSCAESCDSEALTFQLGLSAIPQINTDLCSGCGACVAPCPQQAIAIKEL